MRFVIAIMVCLFGGTMLRGTLFDIDKILNFINMHAVTSLPEHEYLSYMHQGRNTLASLLNNNTSQLLLDERSSYLHEIVSFIWYLYGLAVNKNQGFVDGVMVLDDADQTFHDFLYNYINRVNKKSLLKRSLISTNPYGYSRRSTHFLQDQKKFIQYGIDIRLINGTKAQSCLPGNKAHILFGRLANGLTFIKLERYGLYYKDGFIGHAGGFLRLVLSRIASRFVMQKEQPLHRKEYMPPWILKTYKKLSGKHCRLKTVKDIAKNSSFDTRLSNLIEKINALYDHLPLRYGNEVILDKKEIESHL